MLDLCQLRDGRLDGADDVALEDEVEVAHRAGLQLLEQPLDRHAARRLCELLTAQPLAARIGDVSCAPFVLDDTAKLARGRRMVEAEDLDRVPRSGLLHL